MNARLLIFACVVVGSAAAAEDELPRYPGAPIVQIGETLVIGGELYRMGYFTSADPLPAVGEFYRRHWRTLGYPTVVDGDFREEGVVSAFYTREGLQRAVVLRKVGHGTLGFCVLRDLWTHTAVVDPPLLEGTIYGQALWEREAPRRAWHRTSLVRGTVAEVHRRVIDANAGFELIREDVDGERSRVLQLRNQGGEELTVTLRQVSEDVVAVGEARLGT